MLQYHLALRDALDTPCLSQTDSEVIVHLFERHLAAQTEAGQDQHAETKAGSAAASRANVDDPLLAAFRATLDVFADPKRSLSATLPALY